MHIRIALSSSNATSATLLVPTDSSFYDAHFSSVIPSYSGSVGSFNAMRIYKAEADGDLEFQMQWEIQPSHEGAIYSRSGSAFVIGHVAT